MRTSAASSFRISRLSTFIRHAALPKANRRISATTPPGSSGRSGGPVSLASAALCAATPTVNSREKDSEEVQLS